MLLFFQVLLTMFIAELGDKTQLLMVAMTSRFKLRDIIFGSAAAILVLNALAVGVGAVISQFIPGWVIKIIAALAFFYFAWSTLKGDDEDEESKEGKANVPPILTVFATFFLAELGDKTEGLEHAVAIWLACSIGLFAADLLGMLLGHLLKSKLPDGFLDKLAFVIFAVFGFTTMAEGAGLLGMQAPLHWVIAGAATVIFALLCVWTVRQKNSTEGRKVPKSDG